MSLTIPARPFDFSLTPGRAALVVVDMQRDSIEPGGVAASLGHDVGLLRGAIAPITALLSCWRSYGWPVIHTRECHRPDLSDCPPAKRLRGDPSLRIGDLGPLGRLLVAGAPGTDIIPALAPSHEEWLIDKPGKGMFWATELHERLQSAGLTQLVFCGVTTEAAVQSSMREANDRGYECLIVEDATASYLSHFKRAALEMLADEDAVIGWRSSSAEVLAAMA